MGGGFGPRFPVHIPIPLSQGTAMSAPEYLTINELPVGVTGLYEFQFAGGYLDASHVKLDFVTTIGARTNYPLSAGMFVTEFTLQIPPEDIPAGTASVRIYRETPRDEPLLNFSNGSRISERNLDRLAAQTIFVAAEAFDAGAFAVAEDLIGQALSAIESAQAALAAAGTIVSDAQASADTAAAAQAAASLSAAAAALSAGDAGTSAASALASASTATTAASTATTAKDTAVASAATATTKASEASSSASTASAASVNASASASAAASSASTASTHAGTATTKASEASASASAAATSATNAADSATAAAGFATGLQRVTGALTRANVNGKVLAAIGNLTIPANVFQDGDVFAVENTLGGGIIMTQGSGLTMRNSGASGATGNRTIAAYGLAVFRFASGTLCYVSGPGVT